MWLDSLDTGVIGDDRVDHVQVDLCRVPVQEPERTWTALGSTVKSAPLTQKPSIVPIGCSRMLSMSPPVSVLMIVQLIPTSAICAWAMAMAVST